jgi:hypothetical protein
MHFRAGAYDFRVNQAATGAEYSATNGQQSASVALSWVFGDQQFGDTFLYQQNGIYFESRVSYYKLINGLDLTTGHPRLRADRIEIALGRRMSPEEPSLCFGCHCMSASLGVECEFCHVCDAFDKDDKQSKQTARRMIQMMSTLNTDQFHGERAVTCYTCHRGSAKPVSISDG